MPSDTELLTRAAQCLRAACRSSCGISRTRRTPAELEQTTTWAGSLCCGVSQRGGRRPLYHRVGITGRGSATRRDFGVSVSPVSCRQVSARPPETAGLCPSGAPGLFSTSRSAIPTRNTDSSLSPPLSTALVTVTLSLSHNRPCFYVHASVSRIKTPNCMRG